MPSKCKRGQNSPPKTRNKRRIYKSPNFPAMGDVVFGTVSGPDYWERVSTPGKEHESTENWWGERINDVKKVKEYLELVAGPKWKTYICLSNGTTARSKTEKS
ncbi:Uncharacterized protein Adt_01157 [Abeliophyllum distichum]|uniref:Uncharacterized protein n=1 Tax=Abeliophyllum distichum TaxID=126358 RepID=A0ABD1VS25_9LAMI